MKLILKICVLGILSFALGIFYITKSEDIEIKDHSMVGTKLVLKEKNFVLKDFQKYTTYTNSEFIKQKNYHLVDEVLISFLQEEDPLRWAIVGELDKGTTVKVVKVYEHKNSILEKPFVGEGFNFLVVEDNQGNQYTKRIFDLF